MMIRPSTCLRNDYNDIADFCKTENQPVFLTKNGEGDLVAKYDKIRPIKRLLWNYY